MSATVACKTYDTGEIIDEIRENRRYAIASPSTVTGTPSLAMQSAAQMAVVYIYVDDVKISTPLTISGTTKTPIMINGASPSREDLRALSFEVTGIGSGEVLLTTDEPNGSPSSPYPSTEARNAAVPSPPNAVAWVAGDPVPTPYMLANGATGAADGDWVEMSGGSAAIAYGDLT